MKYTLVIQSYGGVKEYRRAIFALLSFFAKGRYQANSIQALIFTDSPAYFSSFVEGLPVQFISLDKQKILSMRGAEDFVHRLKIVAIQKAFQITPQDILYVDSDTCFIQDPAGLMAEVSAKHVFMHKLEYQFLSLKEWPLPSGISLRQFYKFIENRKFSLLNGDEFEISPKQNSWNAGVIALKKQHDQLLDDVLKLTDELYFNTHNNGSEQYAFDVILEKYLKISSSEEYVFHYWPIVQKTVADIYLSNRITSTWAQLPFEQKKNDIEKWAVAMPGYIANHSLMLKDNAIKHFNSNNFKDAWPLALRTLWRQPFDIKLWCDWLYHGKRNVIYLLKKK